MAKRLQEELYGEGGHGSGFGSGPGADGVRAPIARTTETLVAPDPSWAGGGGGGGGGGDDEDDLGSAILSQLRRQRHPPGTFPPPLAFRGGHG